MIDAAALTLLIGFLSGRGRSSSISSSTSSTEIPADTYPQGAWPRAVLSGGEVSIQQTGGNNVSTWRASRYQAAVEFLANDNRSINAITTLSSQLGDLQISADSVALSVVAHWDIETAGGVSEFNFNVGGIAAVPGQQHFVSTDVGDPNTKVAFCSYPDLVSGIADYFGVISYTRYVKALASLLLHPMDPSWFGELGEAGYYALQSSAFPNALTRQQAEKALDARRKVIAADVGARQGA